jgi:hypothetical protein
VREFRAQHLRWSQADSGSVRSRAPARQTRQGETQDDEDEGDECGRGVPAGERELTAAELAGAEEGVDGEVLEAAPVTGAGTVDVVGGVVVPRVVGVG